ncbi:MAG: fibronectin type III domain-containing protein [Ignavibacteriaceae bacterium]|nr:fibronectin type III domain-containing protein [Ignavibacteriaceae bacterium]
MSNDPTEDSELRKIEIYWPTSNSTISEGETKIEYSVTSPYNIRFIELYINGQFKNNIPAGANNSLPSISFNFDSTQIGTSFNYYIVYYDIDGTSTKSQDIINVTIIERQIPPYPPYDLRIIKISDNEINISWKDSSKTVNRYEIYRRNGFYGQYLLLKVVDGSSFNTNDQGLISDSIYFYKIKSFNDYGESGFSEEINTGGIIIYGDIYPPTQLIATAFGTQVVALEWIDNSDNENFFRIERKTEFSEFIEITNISPNVTIFTDIGGNLYAGGTFFYRVKVFSEKDSAISNIAQVTTFDHNLLPPEQLTAKYQSALHLIG